MEIMSEMASKHFSQNIEPETFVTKPIIFGDFMKAGAEEADRSYEDIVDLNKLKNVLGDVSVQLLLLFTCYTDVHQQKSFHCWCF